MQSPSCYGRVVSLAEDTATIDDEGDASGGEGLGVGGSVGRYRISGLIGRGSMGTVFAATDPKLARVVALKVVASRQTHGERARRLVREARALAQLNHPNVVTVHDVGIDEFDRVYIAMELVEGRTLSTWLDESPPLRERKRVFAEVGRGLLAAHASGLVHRDVKPDNIMLSSDGRAVLLDFGLVHGAGAGTSGMEDAVLEEHAPADTTVGIVGTPAFMPPEQAAGGRADARSDQYSFALMVWQGLYGERPFGDVLSVDAEARIRAGDASPAGRSSVRRPLRAAMLRALSWDAGGRWPSLEPLLDELERRPVPRGVIALSLGALGIVAAAAVRASSPSACPSPEAFIGDAWGEPSRRAATAALGEGDDGTAPAVHRLDGYAESLMNAHAQWCEHEAEETTGLCLRARREAFTAIVNAVIADPGHVRSKIVDAVDALPAPLTCLNPPLHRPAPPEPALASAVQRVDEQLSQANALASLGKLSEARAQVDAAFEEAERLGYPPQMAEARMAEANVRAEGGEAGLTQLLEDAYTISVDAGAHRTALDAATGLTIQLGKVEGRPDAARAWAKVAYAHVPRSERGLSAELSIAQALAITAMREGDVETALAEFIQAYERSRALEPEHVLRVEIAGNLAVAYSKNSQAAAAREFFVEAREALEARYGPRSVQLARMLGNEGHNLLNLGELDEAIATLERSLAMTRALLGEEHPLMLGARTSLGAALIVRGELDRADEALAGTLETAGERFGTESKIASLVGHLLGLLAERRGELERADFEYTRALERCERWAGGVRRRCGWTRAALGHLRLLQDRPGEAQVLLSDASKAVAEDATVSADERAQVDLHLGMAMVRSGRDADRGWQLVEQHASTFEGDDPRWVSLREELVVFRTLDIARGN